MLPFASSLPNPGDERAVVLGLGRRGEVEQDDDLVGVGKAVGVAREPLVLAAVGDRRVDLDARLVAERAQQDAGQPLRAPPR